MLICPVAIKTIGHSFHALRDRFIAQDRELNIWREDRAVTKEEGRSAGQVV